MFIDLFVCIATEGSEKSVGNKEWGSCHTMSSLHFGGDWFNGSG